MTLWSIIFVWACLWAGLATMIGIVALTEDTSSTAIAKAEANAAATVQAAQPICEGQIMHSGDLCYVYMNGNLIRIDTYEDRLLSAQQSAKASAGDVVGNIKTSHTQGLVILGISLPGWLLMAFLLIQKVRTRHRGHVGSSRAK